MNQVKAIRTLLVKVGAGTLDNGPTIDTSISAAFPEFWEEIDNAVNGDETAAFAFMREVLGG